MHLGYFNSLNEAKTQASKKYFYFFASAGYNFRGVQIFSLHDLTTLCNNSPNDED